MKTIDEIVQENGGIEVLDGCKATNGITTWTITKGGTRYGYWLRDDDSREQANFNSRAVRFAIIPGFKICPREVRVYLFAVKLEGEPPKILEKEYFENEAQVIEKFREKGILLEYCDRLKNTAIKALKYPDGNLLFHPK